MNFSTIIPLCPVNYDVYLLNSMKLVILLCFILSLGLAKKNKDQRKIVDLGLLGVNNVTTFNAESSKRIVIGDRFGNLSVLNTFNSQITQPQQVHSSQIIQIQRVQYQSFSGYITVDQWAFIVYWNTDLTATLYQEDNVSAIISDNVTSSAINQRGHKRRNKNYLLAIATDSSVYEYSLNNRNITRNITNPSANRIVSIVYIGKNLYAAVQNEGLYIAGENDRQFQFLAKGNGDIDKLTAHEEGDFQDDDGIAVLNKTFIVHFTKHGFSKKIDIFFGGYAITSLNQCESREKHSKEDLTIVGFEDGSIYIIGGKNEYFQRQFTTQPIQAIACQQDQILYIDQSNNLVSFELDHLQHSRPKTSGLAAILLAVVVFVIVACIIKRRRDKRRRMEESMDYHSGVELQERGLYQAPQ